MRATVILAVLLLVSTQVYADGSFEFEEFVIRPGKIDSSRQELNDSLVLKKISDAVGLLIVTSVQGLMEGTGKPYIHGIHCVSAGLRYRPWRYRQSHRCQPGSSHGQSTARGAKRAVRVFARNLALRQPPSRVSDKMPRRTMSMIGTKLAHDEITSHLGTGGMGEVYQATDSKLGRSVAIKLLPEAFSHDSERVARFEREARVLASLNHPTIAAIYGRRRIRWTEVPGDGTRRGRNPGGAYQTWPDSCRRVAEDRKADLRSPGIGT